MVTLYNTCLHCIPIPEILKLNILKAHIPSTLLSYPNSMLNKKIYYKMIKYIQMCSQITFYTNLDEWADTSIVSTLMRVN